MDDYEEENYSDNTETSIQGVPDIPIPELGLESETLRYMDTLTQTDYAATAIKLAEKSHLSAKAIRGFKAIVGGYFSRSSILSNISDIELAQLQLQKAMNEWTSMIRKTDQKRSEYPLLCTIVQQFFQLFIVPRATGKERERMTIGKQTIEQRQTIVNEGSETRKRRGLGILDRG